MFHSTWQTNQRRENIISSSKKNTPTTTTKELMIVMEQKYSSDNESPYCGGVLVCVGKRAATIRFAWSTMRTSKRYFYSFFSYFFFLI